MHDALLMHASDAARAQEAAASAEERQVALLVAILDELRAIRARVAP